MEDVIQQDAPLNVAILDVDSFIKKNEISQVTSLSINEPSSNTYNITGLFSEQIFGPLGSTERMITFGYIKLNTKILQPLIYKNVVKLGSLYEDIMSGTTHAYFDKTIGNFVRCTIDGHEDSGTGFTFFMNHFNDIEFTKNESRIRADRIDIIEKYKNNLFCDKLLVLPAGLRDLEEDQGNITVDDINKLYQSLLSYSFALPVGANSTIYDGVRMNIQRKAVEIYNYIENIMTGKKGFIQGAWGQRRVALGTRNVISAASYATLTPNDPQTIQPDETKLGLFQTMKAIQPVMVHYVRTRFFTPIFGQDSNTIALTNPKTYALEYREISNQELNKFDTSAAIESWISKFINIDIRFAPVTIKDITGKPYYLCMIYDTGTEISLFRSLPEFQQSFGGPIDKSKIRPLTWAELFYMACYAASKGKHVFITRYPVIQDESCYPSKIHLCTTTPSRVVRLVRNIDENDDLVTYPEYPVLDKPFADSVVLAASRLAGLGGDFDGDTVSANAIISEEANAEIDEFLGSVRSILNSQKQLLIGARDDLIGYSLRSLSI